MEFFKSTEIVLVSLVILFVSSPVLETLKVALSSNCRCSLAREITCCNENTDLTFTPILMTDLKGFASFRLEPKQNNKSLVLLNRISEIVLLSEFHVFSFNLHYKPPNLSYRNLSVESLQNFRI